MRVRTVAANDDTTTLVKSHTDGDDKKFYTIAMQEAYSLAGKIHSR